MIPAYQLCVTKFFQNIFLNLNLHFSRMKFKTNSVKRYVV
jgi:hypothetical protein